MSSFTGVNMLVDDAMKVAADCLSDIERRSKGQFVDWRYRKSARIARAVLTAALMTDTPYMYVTGEDLVQLLKWRDEP